MGRSARQSFMSPNHCERVSLNESLKRSLLDQWPSPSYAFLNANMAAWSSSLNKSRRRGLLSLLSCHHSFRAARNSRRLGSTSFSSPEPTIGSALEGQGSPTGQEFRPIWNNRRTPHGSSASLACFLTSFQSCCQPSVHSPRIYLPQSNSRLRKSSSSRLAYSKARPMRNKSRSLFAWSCH